MKKILFAFSFIGLYQLANGQTTKGYWLVGGSGSVSQQQEKLFGSDIKTTDLRLSPVIGYFILNNFAIGLKPSFSYLRLKTENYDDKSTSWGVGPFLRYYILPDENRINILAETSYQYLSASRIDYQNLIVFSAGPVLYFNSSVGLELTGNYRIFHTENANAYSKTFSLAIGFQIHLIKSER